LLPLTMTPMLILPRSRTRSGVASALAPVAAASKRRQDAVGDVARRRGREDFFIGRTGKRRKTGITRSETDWILQVIRKLEQAVPALREGRHALADHEPRRREMYGHGLALGPVRCVQLGRRLAHRHAFAE